MPKESIKGDKVFIAGREARHILDVMRLKKSDKVVIFDGSGEEYSGFIKDTAHKSLVVEITARRGISGRAGPVITLIQAIPKKEKMDRIVEKATELGVHSIIPVITDRTIVDWETPKKLSAAERWRRIAKEASKQCGRVDIPNIGDVEDFDNFFKNPFAYDLALMAALSDEAVPIKDALKPKGSKDGSAAIAIGPEGDFTPREIALAKERNFKLINLGSRVLKSDTASLVVLSILNYELSNGRL